MTAVLVALVSCALALGMQRLLLRRHARLLEANEQAFRFHAIRDSLQLLAVRGEVDPKNDLYAFLMWTANLAIRNAGVMKLRDVLSIAHAIEHRVGKVSTEHFNQMIRGQPKEMQRLTAETFGALALMLVANDVVVRAGWQCARVLANAWRGYQHILHPIVVVVDGIAGRLTPSRAQAVDYARQYSRVADGLGAYQS